MLAITPTNRRRELINELVQQSRLASGELGETVGESVEHERFHVGDRVMFVGRNDRRSNLQNGLIGTVVGTTDRGELVIALNQEQTQMRVLPAEYVAENLRLAYAVTDYKGQGVTVEEAVMVAAPEELSLNRGYVAASRAREQTRLVLISQTQRRAGAEGPRPQPADPRRRRARERTHRQGREPITDAGCGARPVDLTAPVKDRGAHARARATPRHVGGHEQVRRPDRGDRGSPAAYPSTG